MTDTRIKVGLDDRLLARVDAARGLVARERWIRSVIVDALDESEVPVLPTVTMPVQEAYSTTAATRRVKVRTVKPEPVPPDPPGPQVPPPPPKPVQTRAKTVCEHEGKYRFGSRVCVKCGDAF
jgi:hypothetical protein